MLSSKVKVKKKDDSGHSSTYSTRYFTQSVPKFKMPKEGMPANAAYQLIHDELNLDGNPALNLASFVTTWMEPEAEQLIMQNLHRNFIDHDEYPQTEIIHERLVNMMARLFNAPKDCVATGTSTLGSSEAIMLGLLAHKWSWKKRREEAGKPCDKPNIIFGADTHCCWEKFARYFDVEPRVIPLTKDRYIITVEEVEKRLDENTICVGAVLGTTFTGQLDPIGEINDLLINVKKKKGWDIPMHVDGASGGFVAPFVHPELEWDFRLERVKSINVSGHKYGLVYPGVGWLIFRDRSDLPDDIVFKVNYLGGEMPTFTLNFSKGSAMVLAQYYNFIRLGYEGYANIMKNTLDNARYLAGKLAKCKRFKMMNLSDILPIIAFRLKDSEPYTIFQLSDKIREKGWIIAAYTMPPEADDLAIMRIVVRENFSRDMADMLYSDILETCDALDKMVPVPDVTDRQGHKIC